EGEGHGNFFDPAYAAISARADWMRRFNKVHAQAARSLPKAERRWRELDSSTSSDALLDRFDRTEVDLRIGSLLIEAKLTEGDFQTCQAQMVEQYRDLDAVFDRALLPKIELPPKRRKEAAEFPENYSQEDESLVIDPELDPRELPPE